MNLNQKYQHRMSSKRIKLVRADQTPLSNKEVLISQKKHKFLFGCGAFDSIPLMNGEFQGEDQKFMEERFEKWLALFNAATMPFYWGGFEPERGKPKTKPMMKAVEWLKENGVEVKGHPLCWHTNTAPWLLDLSNEEILKVQLERIHRDVTDFKGKIDMWDVINEVVIMPIFDKYDNGITRICKDKGRIGLIREVFAAAKEANPNAILLLNDFNTSISYEILIDGCLEAGIPIDVIGIQSHQHQGYWGLEKTHEVLERYSHFGLPIHFTENTLISGSLMPPEIEDLNDFQVEEWPTTPEGEERQAREVVQMYQTLFEHPSVEAITTWNIVDGKWLKAPAGFLRKDNSSKPAYDELLKLIKQEWWTTKNLVTDAEGYINVSGFKGDYEVITGDCKGQFTLDRKDETETIIIL
ncbi:endo-1,4-beta-xylanase [Mobilitalea sibirica]|uniref:Beta-xylanase n=1 Tax=Mobilitalea sibirica TaxID=1462919 RepID=A0A8J7HCD2_9FIRM|nr:endo-1,4-beta-xylanase [Mobilitalea sibirica]MBH1940852.1 endo-1,4-beta-xylanase [Mobilitalea sibirica]